MVKIEDYAPIVGEGTVEAIREMAEIIRGERAVHVNATSYGGGVAEILSRMIPLARSLGIDVTWQTLKGDIDFFKVTKKMHNALQGDLGTAISDEEFAHYLKVNAENAALLELDSDVVVIHDPQPLPLVRQRGRGKWAWRCHIDTSTPNEAVWSRLDPMVRMYDLAIFSMERYIPKGLAIPSIIDYPTIDPLSPKNAPMKPEDVTKVLERYGVDPDRPLIGQVARFDPWKDPLGAIDVFRRVKSAVPGIQLAMIGSFARDDPEGAEWYERVLRYAGREKDIFVLSNLDGVGDLEVNAFQRAFSVAIQLSKREGFGLTVTEALWKGVPVVAKRAGGIPLQVIDGTTGFLTEGLEDAAERVALLLRRSWLARELGERGRQHVRLNFLITKGLSNYLRMHIELVGKMG
ncbi:MAG: glycosyltransferase [Candidatus Methanosuratincola petrocarbonis]|nr:glycosyltransferase [Candidatus Methanosuratincola sp.]